MIALLLLANECPTARRYGMHSNTVRHTLEVFHGAVGGCTSFTTLTGGECVVCKRAYIRLLPELCSFHVLNKD